MKTYIAKLQNGELLSESELIKIFTNIISNGYAEADVIAFLLALNDKADIYHEIKILRDIIFAGSHKITGFEDAIDLCGTGGDNLNYLNISTCSAFIVASAGIQVAKHGNRGVSSKSGSSDVLTSLGVDIMLDRSRSAACLSEIGIAFLFAPLYHPILKNVAEIRNKIGQRTIFNILGPLLNPASVKRQLIGVYDFSLAETICEVMRDNGSERVIVVHGANGADEVTTVGVTKICELNDGEIKFWDFDPKEFGLEFCNSDELVGGDSNYNAKRIVSLLEGEQSAFADNVVLNSAFAIYLVGAKTCLQEAILYARDLINAGKAMQKFNQLKNFR
ncbi:MAG: anthranilate phosphoribosyltransferase [Rickettsiales bacterium]|jgi:anthranilate phosphoribosyltransferase|nr:anthranilate phosphoribosyltransferase [Rickettsiales bacterium]